jgi:hypothetical protein
VQGSGCWHLLLLLLLKGRPPAASTTEKATVSHAFRPLAALDVLMAALNMLQHAQRYNGHTT